MAKFTSAVIDPLFAEIPLDLKHRVQFRTDKGYYVEVHTDGERVIVRSSGFHSALHIEPRVTNEIWIIP